VGSSPASEAFHLTGRFDNVCSCEIVIRGGRERRALSTFICPAAASMDGAHQPGHTFPCRLSTGDGCGAISTVSRSLSPFSAAAKRLLIDCLGGGPRPGSGRFGVRLSSQVAGLGPLVQRPQLLKAGAPLPERLLPPPLRPAAPSVQPRRAEGAERTGGRAPPLGGEHLQGVEGPRVRVLVGVADDLAQVARQVLAGEGQGAPRELGGEGLALGREPGGGHVPAEAGGGGGGGGCRGGQRGGDGCPAEGVQRLSGGRCRCRLVEKVVVMVMVEGWERVVQGSGAAVLDRLGRARLEGLLQLRHVIGILDTHTHNKCLFARTHTHTPVQNTRKSHS